VVRALTEVVGGMEQYLDVVEADERHARSTMQREHAAAELGMPVADFVAILDEARRMGFDIGRYSRTQ
jgi:hypothetical protein